MNQEEFARTDRIADCKTGLFTFQQEIDARASRQYKEDWHIYVRSNANYMLTELIRPLILRNKPLVFHNLPEIEHKDQKTGLITMMWRIIVAYLYAQDANLDGDWILTPPGAKAWSGNRNLGYHIPDLPHREFRIVKQHPEFSERLW